ncbi:MAG: PatB family C-S lyase [Alistipes sp.]|nr:PatB family C-S lyase [Alistipes sp.]
MKYNFDQTIIREGTDCEKFDARNEIFGRTDVIPMWVADMDFAVAPAITDAIKRRAEHPVFGYTMRCTAYWQSIIGWVQRHSGWALQPEWLDFSPGVVSGIVFALRAFTQEGDGVVIQPPVYHPFARQTRLNGRKVINNPLRQRADGCFEIDFEDLDRKLAQAKVFLLCNPHNPSGRVFTEEELRRMGELCIKHDVLIVSDEIHCDLVFKPYRHLHIAALSEELAQRTITLIAPSKTFNIAGLSTSVVIVPNPEIRKRLQQEFEKMHVDQGNIFGCVALQAAYSSCDEWLDEAMAYIEGNVRCVQHFLETHLPSVKMVHPEGTFLLWLDFRAWPMSHEEIYQFLLDKAHLGLNEGSMFGEEGRGWMRMNIGTRRAVLEQALEQLRQAAVAAGLGK